ncbi:heavy metal translocating P-type ATPase [Actibacterium sp. XHP0104]|uniref:heavy metal translocating P-type ATPase n=1 Tax=Actibacterium sp. XHP0104 TaxID=2984335 RepID=UPI0021E8E976|nr:heavy metal translocating P-type ATPase [Actibacterium sp. XHP0104]MCV2881486.1 heavy metal translocating P-type ATPase [Actibacterium sp. XHP0104]
MSAQNTARLNIAGLNCASCVRRAETALSKVPNVTEAHVNLASKSADVHYDGALSPVLDALRGAGFGVETQEVLLDVEGASCASCVGRIEKAALAQPGVMAAAMNLASGQLRVQMAGGDAGDIARAVTDAGYHARAHTPDTPQEDRTEAELRSLRRDLTLAVVLTLPVFILAMGGHLIPAFHHWIAMTIGDTANNIIQFVLTSAVLVGPGRRFYRHGVPLLLHGAPDMNALVAMGTFAAWAYSTVATFAPGLLPEGARGVYFEAAAVIVTLILLGRLLEARAKGRTGAAIKALMGLRPDTARVLTDAGEIDRPVAELQVGDIIRLRPGERIATDGEVTGGDSYVDESMITGEPVPVQKHLGAPVTGGTINGQGTLTYRATRVGSDTVLARIIDMVQAAQGAKLPIQGMVDRITAWFVPAVMAAAALTVVLWLIFGPDPALTFALVAGVSVLIIACPCAMGLATPTSIMVGTGRAAELGVLFRKGDALQSLHEVAVVAFDKTGTLTEGKPALTSVALADGVDRDALLRQVAAVEALSEHPIARAIADAAKGPLPTVDGFQSITGYGLRGTVQGADLLVGAERLMLREGIEIAALAPAAADLARTGATPVFAAVNGQLAAVLGVSDTVKPSARAAIAALHAQGVKTAMITGDTQATADAIAADLGIDHVVAGVLPEGKVAAVQDLMSHGKLAFVGDGINDAPALARADVGIAIGTGTDVAIEAADVVLMSGDVGGVERAFAISHATLRNIRQNLFWAFGYNVLLIPVAAGALYIFGGPLLSPMLAAGAMALSSVFVVTNALRLRRAGGTA